MCGIAGAYQQVDGLETAERMSELVAHRGPDGAGIYSNVDDTVSVHLAHRRLSIIDIAGGKQPFVKGGLALAYNGELYNFREIRRDLEARGARFFTSSDTEVVLEAWREWGPDCLRRFRGMFAFAVFEEKSGRLFLARDQLGVKPLYYMLRKDGLVFSSELKALVGVFGSDMRIDADALVASILYYWVPDQRSSFVGVEKLQPGTWMECRPDGFFAVGRYWDPVAIAQDAAASVSTPDLCDVLEGSIEAHLVADVPVSSFLSGGLDSSIVTVLARRHLTDIDAYTITFRASDHRLEAMPDDAIYARRVARQFGIRLHEIEIAPNVVELLPKMVGILDEPIGDPAAINTYLMCSAARDAGVKVLLSGMGADELFGGYRKHVACVMSSQYKRLPAPVRSATRGAVGMMPVTAVGRGLRYSRWAKRFLTFSDLPEEEAFRRSYSLYSSEELLSLLDPALDGSVERVLQAHADIYGSSVLSDHPNRMCLADSRHFLPGLNLTYTDRSSMAASTEVRVPFVDPEVFKAAFAIPGAQKVKGRTGKRALKSAAREWLPDEIIHRPKASFSAPLRAWIAHDLRELVNETLVAGELVACGFLRGATVDRLIESERMGREDLSKQIWQLLTLELWYRQARDAGASL